MRVCIVYYHGEVADCDRYRQALVRVHGGRKNLFGIKGLRFNEFGPVGTGTQDTISRRACSGTLDGRKLIVATAPNPIHARIEQ